jgi:hypothetical protein
MVGDPRPESVGQELEQLVVVLTRTAALPGGLGRHHFSQDARD